MQYYSYEEFKTDIQNLVQKLSIPPRAFKPDAIIAIARGGLTMGHFLGIALDIRNVFTVNAIQYFNKQKEVLRISNIPSLEKIQRILLVDDIVDSGESLDKVYRILLESNPSLEIKTATIFYKPTASIMPDFTLHEAKEWIEFFWEVDVLKNEMIELQPKN